MLNRSTSLAMSTSVLKALPSKLDIKKHSPRIYIRKQFHKSGCSRTRFNFAYKCRLLITFANSFGSGQARPNVAPDLDPNCLTL